MDSDKLKCLMKTFVMSQFQYSPLVWMCHSRGLNQKINKIHERALRIAYKDFDSHFEELLRKDSAVTVHEKNLQILATELFKTKNDLNPPFMKDIFIENNSSYSMRSGDSFERRSVKTVKYGTECLSFRGARLWQKIPPEIKSCSSLLQFKSTIKTWTDRTCECRLCKTYIPNLGFI